MNTFFLDGSPDFINHGLTSRKTPQVPSESNNYFDRCDSNPDDGRYSKMILNPIKGSNREWRNEDLTIFTNLNGQGKASSDLASESNTDVVNSVYLDKLSDDKNKPTRRLSTFEEAVEAASAKGNNSDNRPATCIPIIDIEYATEPDVHARQNMEPEQKRYKDPKTGIPFIYMSKQMHQLAVPMPGDITEKGHPGRMFDVHPVLVKRQVKKELGVKRIQYLIARREKRAKKTEERMRKKIRQNVIDAENRRMGNF